MLSRYQRGYVYQTGSKVKTWYGRFREDVPQADGQIVRRSRNVRLGTVTELPTKTAVSKQTGRSFAEFRSFRGDGLL